MAYEKGTAAARGRRVLGSMAFVVVLAAVLPAAAAAAVVGDPGPRSFQIDSSDLFLQQMGGETVTDTVGPVQIAVADDGSFTVPKGAFNWASIPSTLPTSTQSVGPTCWDITIQHGIVNRTATLAATSDAAGTIDPATGSTQIGVDMTLAPADVVVPVEYSGNLSCVHTSGSTTFTCTIGAVPVHLDLVGDPSNGTDPESGSLHLVDESIAAPTTSSCSGGAILGDAAQMAAESLQTQLDRSSLTAGILDLMASISPGVHSPVPPVPVEPGPAPVPNPPAAVHRKCKKHKKKHHGRASVAKRKCHKKKRR